VVHDVVQSKVLEELSCKYLKHATCNHAVSSGAATDNMADLDQFSGENCRGSISQEKIKGPLRHTLQGGSRC
jgi:hypothetical protein